MSNIDGRLALVSRGFDGMVSRHVGQNRRAGELPVLSLRERTKVRVAVAEPTDVYLQPGLERVEA